jgi:hypothetical protein
MDQTGLILRYFIRSCSYSDHSDNFIPKAFALGIPREPLEEFCSIFLQKKIHNEKDHRFNNFLPDTGNSCV